MSRQRSDAQELAKQLADAAQPIYLVDDHRAIIYCNPACAAWVNVAPGELLGQKCVYGPPPAERATPAAAAAARLCPPPAALNGLHVRGQVSAIAADGGLIFREADFWPLSPETPTPDASAKPGAEESDASPNARSLPSAILALVEPVDRSPAPPQDATGSASLVSASLAGASDDATSDGLHAELLRWRHRFTSRYGLERMVGTSPAAARVRAQVALAAAAPTAVLVTGPAGSGKEHVAKAIHYRRGADSAGTLVPVACAALDVELTISTLRALARSAAGEGRRRSLLLSNVDALSLETQGVVMQLLGPLDSSRVIATASRPAAELVAEGKLRADLAAALTTLSIELVSLSQRIEDLPLLAQMFLEEINATASRQVAGFTPEASINWPLTPGRAISTSWPKWCASRTSGPTMPRSARVIFPAASTCRPTWPSPAAPRPADRSRAIAGPDRNRADRTGFDRGQGEQDPGCPAVGPHPAPALSATGSARLRGRVDRFTLSGGLAAGNGQRDQAESNPWPSKFSTSRRTSSSFSPWFISTWAPVKSRSPRERAAGARCRHSCDSGCGPPRSKSR